MFQHEAGVVLNIIDIISIRIIENQPAFTGMIGERVIDVLNDLAKNLYRKWITFPFAYVSILVFQM